MHCSSSFCALPIAAKQKGYFARSIGKADASKIIFDLSCMMRCPTADNKRHQTEDCRSNVESRHCCHEGRCKCAHIIHAPQHYAADNSDTEQVGNNAYPLRRSADNLMYTVAKAQHSTVMRGFGIQFILFTSQHGYSVPPSIHPCSFPALVHRRSKQPCEYDAGRLSMSQDERFEYLRTDFRVGHCW